MFASGLAGWPGGEGAGPSNARSGRPASTSSGERHATTDPTSGVALAVALDEKPWGTEVHVSVGNVTGPRSCRLLAVTRDGTSEQIATWRVPATGYRTADHSRPLTLTASTELARADIQRIELRAVEPSGSSTLLSSLPV